MVFLTDGMLERNVAGIDVAEAILASGDLRPREVVREFADSALAAAGPALQDDATVLCLDWHGTHERTWKSSPGADTERASALLS